MGDFVSVKIPVQLIAIRITRWTEMEKDREEEQRRLKDRRKTGRASSGARIAGE